MCVSKKVEDSPNSVLRRYQVFSLFNWNLRYFNIELWTCMVFIETRGDSRSFTWTVPVAKNNYRYSSCFGCGLLLSFSPSLELFRFLLGWCCDEYKQQQMLVLVCAVSFSFDLGEFVFSWVNNGHMVSWFGWFVAVFFYYGFDLYNYVSVLPFLPFFI